MRWRFFNPSDPVEANERDDTLRKIDSWWEAFVQRSHDIEDLFVGKQEWDLAAWMYENLQAVHPELMWEFGPAAAGGRHRLVITPESDRWLRPLVATILERAPKIDGWEFYAYRLADALEWALTSVKGRAGLDVADARVSITPGDDQRIDLRYSFAACTSEEDERALHAAFVATESILGEDVLDRWIGEIEVAPLRRKSAFSFLRREESTVPLAELLSSVKFAIDGIIAPLPSIPCIERVDAEWAMWKLKPSFTRKEFAAQNDMFVGKSMYPEMWRATRLDQPFHSDVYSRFGETFCYLKMDGSEGLDKEHFADKGEIEDALDEALRREHAGCFIGGGTGVRYSYIDFALTDVERGAAIIGEILRGGNINKRSWILFYDAALAVEWIGIWPDTPPPPLGEDADA